MADGGNNTIRKITPDRVVTTLAGLAGEPGSADGNSRTARFNFPEGIAADQAGTVYVTDLLNATIRKITANGMVSTLAGSAGQVGSADGAGSAARFNLPSGLAVDNAGNLYVGDYGNNTIRHISPAGVVTTFAGSAGSSGSVDGTGNAARFNSPAGVAVDGAGNLYVADTERGTENGTIRKITPDGQVTTLAGKAGTTGSTDGMGSAARFSGPLGVAVDSADHVYVADTWNCTVRRITPNGNVTTLAGLPAGQALVDGSEVRQGFIRRRV